MSSRAKREDVKALAASPQELMAKAALYRPSATTADALRSGHTVTASAEVHRISSLADDADRAASALQREITRLRAVVSEMKQHKQQTVAFSVQQRALISPARRLPTETLMQIFGYVCAHVEFSLLKASYPAVDASQVCQRWRAIVLDSPSLWCPGICIAVADIPYEWEWYFSGNQDLPRMQKKTEQMQTALRTYVQRSGSASLDVCIVRDKFCGERQATAICKCIAEHFRRWRSLQMTTVIATHLGQFFDNLHKIRRRRKNKNEPPEPAKTPHLLESLTIDYHHPNGYNKAHILHIADVPQLRKVSVPCLLRLPWDQLTNVHISDWIDLRSCMTELIAPCRLRLQALRVSIEWADGNLGVPCVLPELGRLHINAGYVEVAARFFSRITTPALTHLAIRGATSEMQNPERQDAHFIARNEEDADSFLDACEQFVARSGCRVTHLALENASLETNVVLGWLDALPSLEHLRILDTSYIDIIQQPDSAYDYTYMEKTPSCISQSLFLAMTDPGWNEDTQPPQTILPRLKSFYHKGATKYAFQEAEMRDIVHRLCQSRSNPPLLFTVDGVGTLK